MTGPGLAAYLGVSRQDLWDRLSALTEAEENELAAVMEGHRMLTQLEQNILTYEGRPHRNRAEYLRGVHENFTENDTMYRTLLRALVSRQEAYDYAPAAVERLRRELAQ